MKILIFLITLFEIFYLLDCLQMKRKILKNRGIAKLIWHDEFNQKKIDRQKWTFTKGHFIGDLTYMTDRPDNAFTHDGCLIIQANQELYKGYNYTSAAISTTKHFSIQNGYYEIRAKVPSSQGAWPSFWTLGDNGTWPKNGEVDIMEFVAWNPQRIYGVLHTKGFDTFSTYYDSHGFSNEFHTFGLLWEPETLSFFVNGIMFERRTSREAREKGGEWPFADPGYKLHIILDLGIGGWAGAPNASSHFPQQFIVDFIRVWEYEQMSFTNYSIKNLQNDIKFKN